MSVPSPARDIAGPPAVLREKDYPDLLRSLPERPEKLYALGFPPDGTPALALVGSRRPSAYGRRMARALAREAAARGLAVVSGLAAGIDAEAHAGALEAGGKTWAVLGSGLDRIYPEENKPLARRIVESGGCLLSEFEPGTPPLPGNFPRRNRIVAGLCWGAVVVEGRAKSGSLITARLALAQGREVFAVPGPADSPLSEAPYLLMREGAKPVRCLDDLLEDMPPGLRKGPARASAQGPAAAQSAPGLSAIERRIWEMLGSEERSLEDLCAGAGLGPADLSAPLFHMELKDLIQSLPGQRYAKKIR